ncbi:MAG: glutamate ligase domain-containing protein, partial [Nitriliruptorales bacterium]
ALNRARVSAWRSEVAEAEGVVVLNDAYNANPASMTAALETLVAIERSGRTWAVLGVMAELGDVAGEEHERLGRRCVELGVDRLVVVGADAEGIAVGATDAGMAAAGLSVVADAEAALEVVGEAVGPGDVVLVKGSRVAGLESVAAGLLGEREEGAA